MPQSQATRCTNCGTVWTPAEQQAEQNSAEACPVCGLVELAGGAAAPGVSSADELAELLSALITGARQGGLDADVIVQTLRDELEFAAEMAHTGRHFCVQLIDLGPQESNILQRPVRDRREVLQTRSVN